MILELECRRYRFRIDLQHFGMDDVVHSSDEGERIVGSGQGIRKPRRQLGKGVVPDEAKHVIGC